MTDRIISFDLLRGWAALVMIEVHVVNAFLITDIKAASWFGIVNYVNGLVAPAFLFVAGLVFTVVSERKLEDFRTFGSAFRRQAGRIGTIWAIGYVLHLPVFSFRSLRELDSQGWQTFYQADVLHCIAVSLALLFGLRIVLSDRRRFSLVVGMLGLISVLVAPFLWNMERVATLHPAVSAYLTGNTGSLFPLFPWAGFVLFGGMVGAEYLHSEQQGSRPSFDHILGLSGAGLLLVSTAGLAAPGLIPAGSVPQTDAMFFAQRLGLILLLLLGCRAWVRWRKTSRSFLLTAGRETLTVYVAHLTILYGTFLGGRSLVDVFGGTFSMPEVILATIGLILAMVLLARVWGQIKSRSRTQSRRIVLAGSMVVLAVFFLQ